MHVSGAAGRTFSSLFLVVLNLPPRCTSCNCTPCTLNTRAAAEVQRKTPSLSVECFFFHRFWGAPHVSLLFSYLWENPSTDQETTHLTVSYWFLFVLLNSPMGTPAALMLPESKPQREMSAKRKQKKEKRKRRRGSLHKESERTRKKSKNRKASLCMRVRVYLVVTVQDNRLQYPRNINKEKECF